MPDRQARLCVKSVKHMLETPNIIIKFGDPITVIFLCSSDYSAYKSLRGDSFDVSKEQFFFENLF